MFYEIVKRKIAGSNKRNLPHPVFQIELSGKNTDCTYLSCAKPILRFHRLPDEVWKWDEGKRAEEPIPSPIFYPILGFMVLY